MEYAIIAAGEGSRLKAEGFDAPKPLVSLQGTKLIDRLIGQFAAADATVVHIIINEQSPLLERHLAKTKFPLPVDVIRKTTESSLHSFHTLLLHHPDLQECCLTTTDTVFMTGEFQRYICTFQQNTALDAQMAVTSYVDDERPLYVSVDKTHKVRAFSDTILDDDPLYVSGGIYCLRKKAINAVHTAIAQGMSRMRNYQRYLIDQKLSISAFPFDKIIDIDHVDDIEKATNFLQAQQHENGSHLKNSTWQIV